MEDLGATATRALDFSWGERTNGGVVFRRQSARVRTTAHGANSVGVGGAADGIANGLGDGPVNSMATVVDTSEKIMLPQSTHSLLFTEKILSLPFGFAISVLVVSYSCLGLALWDNMSEGRPGNPLNVPVNVKRQVRVAQFLSILIAIIMEEEIPTASYLIRMLPKYSVENELGVSYPMFVVSAVLRLSIGYLFLLNVWLATIQTDRVLDMFYDMLALNFVALIDDIAFKLAKYDVLGKTLRNATSAAYFNVEFEKRPFLFRKKTTIFVKFLYVFNILTFMGGLSAIGHYQMEGYFQCDSVTVTFGEDVWENAWVAGQNASRVLLYSYFNGAYKQKGTTPDGRPIYVEMSKSNHDDFDSKTPAMIKYCRQERAWVFSHKLISKTKEMDESDYCPWLLRSAETDAYDLLDVLGGWSMWVGVIKKDAEISISCNNCKVNSDCNLNGACVDGKCICNDTTGRYGMHCELEEPCPKLIGDHYNDTWSVIYKPSCEPLRGYGRPVYALSQIAETYKLSFNRHTLHDDDLIHLVFAGNHWMALVLEGGRNLTFDSLQRLGHEYHAFWDSVTFAYDEFMVSGPTMRSYPVGVDFYKTGEKGEQYGPFGLLYPLHEPPGYGHFVCADNNKELTGSAGHFNFFANCT